MGSLERTTLLGLAELCLSLPEPAVSLEQCEQLVAELQGSVRQAVQLYHLVCVGHPPPPLPICPAGRQSTSGVLVEYLAHSAKALPLVSGGISYEL